MNTKFFLVICISFVLLFGSLAIASNADNSSFNKIILINKNSNKVINEDDVVNIKIGKKVTIKAQGQRENGNITDLPSVPLWSMDTPISILRSAKEVTIGAIKGNEQAQILNVTHSKLKLSRSVKIQVIK